MVLCTSLVDFVATIKTDLNFCKIPSFLTPIETEEINRDWDGFGIQSCTTHCLCFLRVWCLSPICRYPTIPFCILNTLAVPRRCNENQCGHYCCTDERDFCLFVWAFSAAAIRRAIPVDGRHTSGGLMASNLGRIVAHAGHPARLTDAAASTSSTAASTYTVAHRLHVCASRNSCTSVYQHSWFKCGTHYCSRLDCITQS